MRSPAQRISQPEGSIGHMGPFASGDATYLMLVPARASKHTGLMIWLREHGVWVLSLAIAGWLGYALVNAYFVAKRSQASDDSVADQARAARVRREVRAKIADVKASRVPPPVPRTPTDKAGKTSSQPLPPIDPFGGRGRRGGWARVRRWFGRK